MQIRYFISRVLLFLLVSPAGAQTFVTNGSATSQGGGCYQLTPDNGGQAGSIFSTNAIDLTMPFSLDARLYFGTKDNNGADGIVFIFATSNTALGAGGGGIGYEGITPSIAIEYDDYFNGIYADPAQDHMAVISMGVLDHNQPTNLGGPTTLNNIEDGEEHCFSFLWDPATQTYAASLDGETIIYTGDIITNIFAGNPLVYFGFSSGTGSLSNVHRVCIGAPVLEPMPDVTVCAGESIELEADPNGITWDWTPHATLDPWDIYNPTATPTTTTEYRVGIEYACGGFHRDSVLVTVIPEPVATANNNGPVCPGESVQLFATGGTSYDWDGPNNYSSSQQNPVINNVTINHAGTYIVTVTDAAGCTSTAETEVELHDLPAVEIDPFTNPLCADGEPIQLTGAPGNGDWSGEINPSGIFNPVTAGEGDHMVVYTITDGNGCTNSAEVIVTVVPTIEADILPPGPFCVTDFVVTLNALPGGGTWGESADSDGQFYPTALGVGSHLVTYTLTENDACYNASIFIEVVEAPVIDLVTHPVMCIEDTLYNFTTGIPPGGEWGGTSQAGFVNPGAQAPGFYYVAYTLELQSGCISTDTSYYEVLPPAPQIQNLIFTCNASNTTYTVTFEIVGGVPASYWVNGSVAGTLTPGTPATYVSDPILSETMYMFSVSDGNACDTAVISGSYSCACPTNAGSMPTDLLIACEGGIINVSGPIGFSLDANDTIVYVLHTGDPTMALMTGNPNTFQFGAPLQAGVTYFIAAIVGNTITGVGVDLNDPCLSISNNTPVMWHPNPDGSLSAPPVICEGDSISMVFTIAGIGPFEATWSDGINTYTASPITSGHVIQLAPAVTTTYSLSLLVDVLSPGCQRAVDTSVTVIVTDVLQSQRTLSICEGDSIFLENEYQFNPGIYHDTLTATLGCDSVVETTLLVNLAETVMQSGTTCIPSEVGVFTNTYQNSLGCDSVVISTITYALVDTTYMQSFSCDAQQVGVTETLLAGTDGCDSLVIDSTFLIQSDTTNIASGNCDPAQTGVFTTILTNGAGCDSVIIETVSLLPSDATSISSISCLPADTGVFIVTYQNSFGCDSVVTETISLAPSYQFSFAATSCNPGDTGVAILNLFTVQGCDSTITTTTSLLSSSSSTQFLQTCFPSDTGTVSQTFLNAVGCDSVVYIITSLYPADTCAVEEISREVYVPNVFSPNGDGINDIFFVIANPDVLSGIQWLRIYDRWGGLVFENTDLQPNDIGAGWNGTVDDEFMNPAVFVWQMHLTYADGVEETLFGDVTLVR